MKFFFGVSREEEFSGAILKKTRKSDSRKEGAKGKANNNKCREFCAKCGGAFW